jgi:two-component system, OmpR family, response regulator
VSYGNHIVNRAPAAFKTNTLFHQPSILIIDDEKDICFLLSNILKQRQMQSVFACSLTEASDIIGHSSEFSFIFIDNHLPDGLGVEFIKKIKEKCPCCKIIMITAHDTEADRRKASYAGADYFIGKPFSRESILKSIDKLSA